MGREEYEVDAMRVKPYAQQSSSGFLNGPGAGAPA